MSEPTGIVIVSAVRTPVGKFQGGLSGLSATQLGAAAVKEAIRRAAIDPATPEQAVDECIMGNVLSAGLGQNPARQAALFGGLPASVAALTINKVCGSGLKAVALAAQAVETGNARIVVAGGMESMSNAPYLLPQARQGFRLGNATAVDSMIHDGLWDVYNDYHMGTTGENVAAKHHITREEQDAFALYSHFKAAAAWHEGRFDAEVIPVSVPSKKRGAPADLISRDESIREDASLEALAALKPAFKKDGTVTAGNAPGVNDAAAALVVMSAATAASLGIPPLVRIVAQATSGVDPQWVMLAPVTGVQKVLARAGWTMDSVDLFELNEAFAVQAIGVTRELGLDMDRVNVNGGAVAIGHPIGASGARILVTLIHEMIRRDVQRGARRRTSYRAATVRERLPTCVLSSCYAAAARVLTALRGRSRGVSRPQSHGSVTISTAIPAGASATRSASK
jgi:acetyl-CoA C-acetyltransferase